MTEEEKKIHLKKKYICDNADKLRTKKRKLLMIIISEITDLKPFESGDGTRYNLDILQDHAVIDVVYNIVHNWMTEIEEEFRIE